MKYNRGEWGEIYIIFKILCDRKIVINNPKLKVYDNKVEIKLVKLDKNGVIYVYSLNEENIEVCINSKHKIIIKKSEIIKCKNIIYYYLINKHTRTRIFAIPEIEFTMYKIFKNGSLREYNKKKYDIEIVDINNLNLRVSLKTNIWYPPTILNASHATTFKYEIYGINDETMRHINSIETSEKIIDRITVLRENNAKIKYLGTTNNKFSFNLKKIDTRLEIIIQYLLLYSYVLKEKRIRELLNNINKLNNLQIESIKKALESFTFWLIPTNINNDIVDLLIIMNFDGELDCYEYDNNITREMLLNNSKLETPSSKKFEICKIKKINNRYYMYLLLQVRFKRKNYKKNNDEF